jgi:DNA primase
MSDSKKLNILKNVLGDCEKISSEVLFTCPFCNHHKKKLSVNIAKNAWKCWVCDSSGKKVFSLIKRFGEQEEINRWIALDKTIKIDDFDQQILDLFSKKTKKKQSLQLPSDYIFLGRKDLPSDSYAALKYLKDRGITQKQIKEYKIGYCSHGEYENRIIIPSFDDDGDCNYFIARSYYPDSLRYKNPPIAKSKIIFNELLIDFKKPVIIVEGVFDAIKAGHNAAPLLGSTLSNKSLLRNRIVENNAVVYLALDADAIKKQNKIIETLLKDNIQVYIIDTKGYEDIAEMPERVFLERKEKAESASVDLFLIKQKLQDDVDEVRPYFRHPYKKSKIPQGVSGSFWTALQNA